MTDSTGRINYKRAEIQHRIVSAAVDRDEQKLLLFGEHGEDAGVDNLGQISPVAVTRAINFIDGSGVVPQLERWDEEFRRKLRGNRGRAGRRSDFSIRLLLVLFMITLLDQKAPQTKNVASVVRRLTEIDAQRLGIAPRGDESEVALYTRINRAFKTWLDSLDPYPSARHATLSVDAHRELTDQENGDANTEVMLARLDWLANHLLESSFLALPIQYRRLWKGNLAVDATLITAFGAKGTNVNYNRVSSDRDASLYVRGGAHNGEAGDASDAPRKDKRFNGYEATLAVTLPNEPRTAALFPTVAIGMAFHRPGNAPGIEAANCTASIRHRGHPAGLWLGDLAYTDAKREKLRLQLVGLGYDMVLDLKPAKLAGKRLAAGGLGFNGSYKGVTKAIGKHYCPAMPKSLMKNAPEISEALNDRDATPAARKAVLAQWQALVTTMSAYEIKAKAQPKAGQAMVVKCPALGRNATVRCPLRAPASVPAGKVLLPIRTANLPEHPPEICTNKESVSIPFADWADEYQAFAWMSPEWLAHYGMRSIVEGYNGYIKNENAQSMGSSGRRRQRGHHVQYLLAALQVSVANLTKIQRFLKDPPTIPAGHGAAVAAPVEEHDWSVPIVPGELHSETMERRREILDSRSGEDVKAAKRRGDLVAAEALVEKRNSRRRRPPGSSTRHRTQAAS